MTATPHLAQVVLLTGPSGCGKSRITKRLGLPKVPLDNFYFNQDHPDLPRRFGIVDWDDPATWDARGAFNALTELCQTGHTVIPEYDIPTSSRIGSKEVELGYAKIVIAEGVFAAELIAACQKKSLLATAICIVRPRLVTFSFRLARDLKEGRKSIPTLIRRGIGLYRQEPELISKWETQGCQPETLNQAEQSIAQLAALTVR